MINKHLLSALFACSMGYVFAQNTPNIGQVSGNFEVRAQSYRTDTLIGAPEVPESLLMNGFANINYNYGKFSAGMRYESYQNALLGYAPEYKGNGIPYRYAKYSGDNLEVTAGNFYEQFGNGQILRTYEERGLGIDNSIDGFRVKYYLKGIELTGLIGQQRWYFDQSPGIVRGGNVNVYLNQLFESFESSKHRLNLGASVTSKYQDDNNPLLVLPENVLAYDVRFDYQFGNFSWNAEYSYKHNDPSADNGFIYKNGQMLSTTLGYSKKGLGITVGAHTLDNMFYRSDRNNSSQFQDMVINFVPALTKPHTYNLMATLYPYATQPNGEIAYQIDVVKKINKKNGISFNLSWANSIDTTNLNDLDTDRQGYESNLFKPGDTKYWQDINIYWKHKFDRNNKLTVVYQNLFYNKNIIEGKVGADDVNANVGIIDFLHKIDRKHSIRTELQALFTEEDLGDWATILIEYNYSPHWFVSVMDQYNYGNPDEARRVHYFNGSVGYINNSTRITASYGRQREGLFCVGGVCRIVPASNGLTLTISSSF